MRDQTTRATSTVLVADDAIVMRETLREILGAGDYRVVGEAADGAEVMDQVIRLRPEVVALDVVMPGPTGIATLRNILDVSPTTRVVICSSLGQDTLVAEALQEGAHGFIWKPFYPDRTLRTFDRVTDRRIVLAPAPSQPKPSFLRRTTCRAFACAETALRALNPQIFNGRRRTDPRRDSPPHTPVFRVR